jgi:hypothetical protein
MDIYYFYNGINNVINLLSKNEKYLDYYELILNDPLVILDFKDSKKIKGGASLLSKGTQMFGKKGMTGIGNKVTKTLGINGNDNGNKEHNNSNEDNSLSTKEKALKILKFLFTIVYYLCLFSILPLIPFIAISYYSFKRLKIFYNNQMGTL